MISFSKIRNILVGFLGFVLVTCTYVVFAKYSGLPVFVITLGFFATFLFLGTQNLKKVAEFCKSYVGLGLILILVLGPILSFVLNLRADFNKVILQFFYLAIALFTFQNFEILKKYRRFLLIGVYFNLVFGLFSIFSGKFFQGFADVINDDVLGYRGRAIAFYLQPNNLGAATVNLYILSIFLYKEKNIKLFFLPCLITVIASASRTSLAVISIVGFVQVFTIFIIPKFQAFKIRGQITRIILITVGGITLLVTLFLNSSLIYNADYKNLVTRIEFFMNIGEKLDQLDKENSMLVREKYQKIFKNEIEKKPFLGHGFGVQNADMEAGILKGSAHNHYLELLYQGGAIFLVLYIIFLVLLLNQTVKFYFVEPFYFTASLCFLTYIIIYGFFLNTLFDTRSIYLTLGIICYLSVNPSAKKI